MSRKKVPYGDAVARALKAGFKPAFPGDAWKGTASSNKHPWTHLECGETRPQTFHNMLKGTCGGCHSWGRQKMTYDEAVARARKAGFEVAFPRDEWKGASVNNKPVKYLWTHEKCGETHPQTFHSMLNGHCGACSKVSYDDAVARAREAGFEPAFSKEEWQGTWANGKRVKYPWTHQKCGETRPQQFHTMLKGQCGECSKVSYDEVVERAQEAGFTPAFSRDEWQGTAVNGKQVKYLWTHVECGETRPQQFGSMLNGHCGRCGPELMKVPYDDAVARAQEAGFTPAFSRDEWKGVTVDRKQVKYPWTHQKCGETRPQQFHNMLKGTCGGCHPQGRKR